MIKSLKSIINLLDYKDKKIKILSILTFIAAFLEGIGLAAFIPIIEFFSEEKVVGFINYFEKINIIYFENTEPIYLLVSFLFLIFLIKNLYLAFFYLYESKFVFKLKLILLIIFIKVIFLKILIFT